MAEIVLRVRLIGGDHLDVTYGDRDAAEDEVVKYVISTLAEDGGTLRCKHGDRLIVLYGRGVARRGPVGRAPGRFSRTARQERGSLP